MRYARPLAVTAVAMVVACAKPTLDEPEPLPLDDAPTHGSGKAPPASSASASASPDDDGGRVVDAPRAGRWRGTLPATQPVVFGGGQNCLYRITLQQVKVDIVAYASGDIVAASVTARAFEEVLTPSCGTPIPAHTHTYALIRATVLPSGMGHLELAGISTNRPAASLVIEGDFRTESPTLSLAWHRTDYGPPLDWRVNAQLTASPP